jgi:hypothetical protein
MSAIAAETAVSEPEPATHSHNCARCGYDWEHSGSGEHCPLTPRANCEPCRAIVADLRERDRQAMANVDQVLARERAELAAARAASSASTLAEPRAPHQRVVERAERARAEHRGFPCCLFPELCPCACHLLDGGPDGTA